MSYGNASGGVARSGFPVRPRDFQQNRIAPFFLIALQAHRYTRWTLARPNRPLGLTTSTSTISNSAMGSLISEPMTGM